ncbi:MAG: hypothetical protein KIT09_31165 [Bryobacteraceae bacterium]|nr:hypothetical protein [Bryobacteraceae bacterium]
MLLAACAATLARAEPSREIIGLQTPRPLSFEELVSLSEQEQVSAATSARLDRILSQPAISNEAWFRGSRPRRPESDAFGPVLRAAMWNINQGLRQDMIQLALSDPAGFEKAVLRQRPLSPAKLHRVREQLQALQGIDLLVLNEADWGMERTDYRNITRELANSLRMNYAFGVEFLELNLYPRTPTEPDEPDAAPDIEADVDPRRYLGLTGTAILSRYPIRNARIVRLPDCYDWFSEETKDIAPLERARRWSAKRVFEQEVRQQVRRGGRMALIADIDVPDLPEGKATVVATHLEDRSPPACRRQQMAALLSAIGGVENPIILAGDLNTSGGDQTPTSVRRELWKCFTGARWAGFVIRVLNPTSIPLSLLMPVNSFKNFRDPTAKHIPLLLPNPERGLFDDVRRFGFEDASGFDFQGNPERSVKGRRGTLANSNARGPKGFEPTFRLPRTFRNVVGVYKLDWFMIKPAGQDGDTGRQFTPHNARTLRRVNEAAKPHLSDHHPIMVDLPLREPAPRFRYATCGRCEASSE